MDKPFVTDKPDALKKLRKMQQHPLHNISKDLLVRKSLLDRFAVFITNYVGTMGFFLIVLIWTTLWLGWNLAVPKELQFDPPMGFVFWLFISNVLQLLLMPLIMVGQNIQGRYAEARAENDFNINIQSEQKIELVLQHLEYQNAVLNRLGAQLEKSRQPDES